MKEELFTTYSLHETFFDLKEHDFKIVLNQFFFKNAHDSDASIMDSDGTPIRFHLEKWGRKMNFKMNLDESVADGVATVNLFLRMQNDEQVHRKLFFWVVKP